MTYTKLCNMTDEELLNYALTGEALECSSALVVELVNRMERLLDEIDSLTGEVRQLDEVIDGGNYTRG